MSSGNEYLQNTECAHTGHILQNEPLEIDMHVPETQMTTDYQQKFNPLEMEYVIPESQVQDQVNFPEIIQFAFALSSVK